MAAPQATEVADRFHILKNLTEALQLLLGRSLEEIKAASQTPEPHQNETSKAVITVEQWRQIRASSRPKSPFGTAIRALWNENVIHTIDLCIENSMKL